MDCIYGQREELVQAVSGPDQEQLLALLHGLEANTREKLFKDLLVFHDLVDVVLDGGLDEAEAAKCIYALMLHGGDVNQQDQSGDVALLCYLRQAAAISDEILQAFLRCGVDTTLKNKNGEDVLGYIIKADALSKHVKARILDYMPGIWRAVDSDDAMTVRRLVNQWCSIRGNKNGMSVVELAFSKGTENIIRVIAGIGGSMDLAHSVLAGDIVCVQQMLKNNNKANVNLRNMADRGATPLYYAMCNNDRRMVDLLLDNGAKLDVGMQGEREMELPLYFAALSAVPGIDPDLLQHTIPQPPVSVDQLFYKGRNVMYYCIDHNIDVDLFETILRRCSAVVLTQRIENNLDVRSYTLQTGKMEYVHCIDKVVREWILDKWEPHNRNTLALHGYPFPRAIMDDPGKTEEEHLLKFLQLLPEYEEYKGQLAMAVEEGNLISVKEMLYSESWSERGFKPLFADSRPEGCGQPLLHKAVLRNDHDIVREIGECIVYKCGQKLDTVRDQYFRTALHYVYGMEGSKHMVHLLEDLGMSEHVMDKDGRSPLVFKDRRGLKEMNDLLNYHLDQDLTSPEPDPWSVPLPLPIMGYLTKCVHSHHNQRSKLPASDQYDMVDHTQATPPDIGQSEDLSGQYSQLKVINDHSRWYTGGQEGTETDQMNRNMLSNKKHLVNGYKPLVSKSLDFEGRTLGSRLDNSRKNSQGETLWSAIVDLSSNTHICKSDSDMSLEIPRQELKRVLQNNEEWRKQEDYDDDDLEESSGSYSEGSELDENYEGDYSDNDSDGEEELDRESGYCAIL